VQQRLLDYPWPGNVRELQNAIKHALAMAQGSTLAIGDLPVQILKGSTADVEGKTQPSAPAQPGKSYQPPADRPAPDDSLSSLSRQFVESEKELIAAALNRNQGNMTKTAKELGISRTTLWRKKTMYQIG
jgi:DNA-binding NtrC family response regulator